MLLRNDGVHGAPQAHVTLVDGHMCCAEGVDRVHFKLLGSSDVLHILGGGGSGSPVVRLLEAPQDLGNLSLRYVRQLGDHVRLLRGRLIDVLASHVDEVASSLSNVLDAEFSKAQSSQVKILKQQSKMSYWDKVRTKTDATRNRKWMSF